MGSRNMQDSLKAELDHAYPEGKSDLYSAFIVRALALLASGGILAMITMQSWMFLKSYETFVDLCSRTGGSPRCSILAQERSKL